MFTNGALKDIEVVNGFVGAIVASNSATELCRNIVHSELSSTDAIGCQIMWLDHLARIQIIAGYGITTTFEDLSAWGSSVVARAMRERNVVVETDALGHQLVAVPFLRGATPVGCMLLTLAKESAVGEANEPLVRALSQIGAHYLESIGVTAGRGKETSEDGNGEGMTERQLEVLRLMADSLTNAEIAKILMLSESSIRQETVRIYKALGVSSRNEAARKGKALGFISRVAGAAAAS